MMLNRVGVGCVCDDVVLVMVGVYCSYVYYYLGWYLVFIWMLLGGDDFEYIVLIRGVVVFVIVVLFLYGFDGEQVFYVVFEFWLVLYGFVLLEMIGVMDDIDIDVVFIDMVLWLVVGMERCIIYGGIVLMQCFVLVVMFVLICQIGGGYCGCLCLVVYV